MSKHTCGECEHKKDCHFPYRVHIGSPECPARTRERELLMVLERIEGMAERPVCLCGRPTGTKAIKECANKAIQKAKGKEPTKSYKR